MKNKLIFAIFLLFMLYLTSEGKYCFVKFENGKMVPVDDCGNLEDDPHIRNTIAMLEATGQIKPSSSPSEPTSSKTSTGTRVTAKNDREKANSSPTTPTPGRTATRKSATTTNDDMNTITLPTKRPVGTSTSAKKKNETATVKDSKTSDDSVIEKSTEPMTTQTKTNETQAMTRNYDATATVPTIKIEASTPTPAVTTPATIMEGFCNVAFNGTCYWTHVEDGQNVNFTGAEEICSNNASIPAYFPNEKVYNSVAEDLRSKIPTGWSWVGVWTGVTVDTNTGDVTHPNEDTYVKWFPNHLRTGISYETWTHVVLAVDSDPDDIRQGMYNDFPQWKLHGVVCQTPIE